MVCGPTARSSSLRLGREGQESVAEAWHLPGHAPHRGRRAEAAPGDVAGEEGLKDASGGRPAALLWLFDDDLAGPGEGVDDEDRIGAGLRVSGAWVEVAQVEHALDAGIGDRLGQGAGGAGEQVEGFGRGGVAEVGLAAPLGSGPERLRGLDAGEGAPGVLVIEGGLLVGVGGAGGVPGGPVTALQPAPDRLGHQQLLVGGAADAGLVGAGGDAVGPPVEPVAAPGFETIAVPLADHPVELEGVAKAKRGVLP